jgi:hypothetical protein
VVSRYRDKVLVIARLLGLSIVMTPVSWFVLGLFHTESPGLLLINYFVPIPVGAPAPDKWGPSSRYLLGLTAIDVTCCFVFLAVCYWALRRFAFKSTNSKYH